VCLFEIRNQTVKDPVPTGTRQNPTSSILTKVGSALSQEERQPLDCSRPAYRGTQNIRRVALTFNKNLDDFLRIKGCWSE